MHQGSDLIHQLEKLAVSGQISRRHLLRRATALGLSAPVVALLLAACGGDDEEAAPTATSGTSGAPTATRASQPTPSFGGGTPVASSPTAGAASPVPTQSTAKAAANQTFIYPWVNEARTLDPHGAAEAGSTDVTHNCYEGLVAQAPRSAEIVPRLAKSWDVSPDAQQVTFKLQEGVKFVDGTTMDAEAVKKSFERCIQLNLGPAAALNVVDTIETPDQFTVRFNLKSPNAFFTENLTQVAIISPTAVAQNDKGGDLASAWLEAGNTAGTGPYRLTEFRKNETKTMEAFEGYWRGWQGNHLKKIVCPIVPEQSTVRQMLERGEAHYARTLPPETIQAMESVPHMTVEYIPAYQLWTMPINVSKAPTDNLKIRQALQYAFPYEQYLRTTWNGKGQTPNSPVPPGFLGYDEAMPTFKQDLDRARQLFAESGVSTITLQHFYTETLSPQREAAIALQDILRGMNIEFTIQAMPWATQFANLSNKDTAPNLSNLLIGPTRPDPAFSLEWMFGTSFIGKPYNWSFYSNPQVDTLISQARSTPDRNRSLQLLTEANRLIVADSPVIWYVRPDRADCHNAKIQDWAPIVVGYPGETEFYPMWFAE